MPETPDIQPFAVEHAPDGLYYLHSDRVRNRQLQGFDVIRHPDGFRTDADARAFAKEHYRASYEDFAPSSMIP